MCREQSFEASKIKIPRLKLDMALLCLRAVKVTAIATILLTVVYIVMPNHCLLFFFLYTEYCQLHSSPMHTISVLVCNALNSKYQ